MNRRAFVGTTALVLAGCGDKRFADQSLKADQKRTIAVDYASYYAPIEDVRRLVRERAAKLGVRVVLSDDPAGTDAQVANLKRWTASSGGFRAIAVAPFDAAAVAPVVRAAKDVAVIGYVTAVPGQVAAIRIDHAAAAVMLADRAPDGPALLVAPPAGLAVPNPFTPAWEEIARDLSGRIEIAATVQAQAVDDARNAVAAALTPRIRSVLCWNDQTALGAAGGGRWVGAVGAPALTSRASLKALRTGDIDALVTPRLRDLANALVDLPLAYARGQNPGDRVVPVTALGRRSRALDDFASDFTA